MSSNIESSEFEKWEKTNPCFSCRQLDEYCDGPCDKFKKWIFEKPSLEKEEN